jgi:hypothetical protein
MIGQGHEHDVSAQKVDPLKGLCISESVRRNALRLNDPAISRRRQNFAAMNLQRDTPKATIENMKSNLWVRRVEIFG